MYAVVAAPRIWYLLNDYLYLAFARTLSKGEEKLCPMLK